MADSTKVAAPAAAKPKTITLTFGDEDLDLYEGILADAKADRRSASQYLVIYLAGNYATQHIDDVKA